MSAVVQQLADLAPIALGPEVESVEIAFRRDERVFARLDVPVAGSLTRREVTVLALEALGLRAFLEASGALWRWRLWPRLLGESLRLGAAIVAARFTRRPLPARTPRELVELALRRAVLALTGPPLVDGSLERAVGRLQAEAAAKTMPAVIAAPPVVETRVASGGRTDRLPVLMYHRIADEGPAGLAPYRVAPADFANQLRWLRARGYHAVTSREVARHLRDGDGFGGRPVMLSFDDGYRDFHDVAWPLLRAEGFTAEVFVVTGLVGSAAVWDAEHGPPAPLMDWREIQLLAAAGVRFGSHMQSHSRLANLSLRDIALEAAGSRAALERALGVECRSVAAPFGEDDQRFHRIVPACGYETAFTITPGVARLGDDPFRLPRVDVRGDLTIEGFARALG